MKPSMKRFVAIYTGSPEAMSRWEELSELQRTETQTAGIVAWHKWAEDNKASIVEIGGPLGRTKLISSAGIGDIRNSIAGFTIVEAATQEAAAKLFLNHPHFSVFPGAGIEVMEVMPVPSI